MAASEVEQYAGKLRYHDKTRKVQRNVRRDKRKFMLALAMETKVAANRNCFVIVASRQRLQVVKVISPSL